MERTGTKEFTRPGPETKMDPILVGIGLAVGFLALGIAPLALGISGSTYPFSSSIAPSTSSLVILGVVVLILLGGAFLVARGLWYPRNPLPGDQSLLRGPTRRRAPLDSRLGEMVSSALLAGAGLMLMGFLVGIPALQGTVCMEGPCTLSDVAPSIPQALYAFGAAAVGLGGILLLIRQVSKRPSRVHPAGIGTQ